MTGPIPPTIEHRMTSLFRCYPCIIQAGITAGTLVPAVLMATSHSYGNGQTLTTHRIRTP